MSRHRTAVLSFVVGVGLLPLIASKVDAAIIFDNVNEFYGQGGFEQYTAGQQVGGAILNGHSATSISTVSMGGTLPPVVGEFLNIFDRGDDGTLGALLFTTTQAPTYVETKPSNQFNPARGTTTFDLHGAITLQADTDYWFVLTSLNPDPTTGPIQWAYTYSPTFTTDVGANFPAISDKVTYFAGEFPDSDPSDPSHYFGLSDSPQLIQITGTIVPEPSSIVLFGLGGIGLTIGASRRRRLAV